ncbi:MAG: VWA domain-containing protein [Gammaproteobacteria bacterium]|nr:MAG: VWA domain-containing protein [Gammaproteobacteria bacterium]RKZ95298.1 MAG: VWA domain-containing protein [Gammaproteobacteria bacterium]RKZ98759.1 MAG: VWA domain-containing protein [Gammaproteobacteria bacterium]RLA02556.1 MAG: VWA domain-containing protein [Gammaproteobacteria bacterium]
MKLSYQSRIAASAFLMLLVIILIMSALWFPRTDRTVKVMDLMFVLDITQSMDVADVEYNGETITRLAWAKEYTKQTLQALPCGSHVGLAAFSESRSLVLINPVEICSSYNDLSQMLFKIDGSIAWALSSEVSKAVFGAIDQAKLMDPSPDLVFITDGHEAPPLHETLFPKYKKKLDGVSGVFVGVGGDNLLPIPKHKFDGTADGFWKQSEVLHEDVYASLRSESAEVRAARPRNEHLSSQKQSHLENLASMLNFDYVVSPTKSNAVINALENRVKTRDQVVDYDWAPWFASIALFLLVLLYLPFRLIRD